MPLTPAHLYNPGFPASRASDSTASAASPAQWQQWWLAMQQDQARNWFHGPVLTGSGTGEAGMSRHSGEPTVGRAAVSEPAGTARRVSSENGVSQPQSVNCSDTVSTSFAVYETLMPSSAAGAGMACDEGFSVIEASPLQNPTCASGAQPSPLMERTAPAQRQSRIDGQTSSHPEVNRENAIRVHVSPQGEQEATVWLGVDAAHRQAVPMLTQILARQLAQRGYDKLNWVCNGQNMSLPDADTSATTENSPSAATTRFGAVMAAELPSKLPQSLT